MNLIPSQYVPSVLSLMFQNTTGHDVIVDKIVARNGDTAPQSLLVYLVASGDVAGPQNLFVSGSIGPNVSIDCLALVGSELASGDALWMLASTINTIVTHANGRQRLT